MNNSFLDTNDFLEIRDVLNDTMYTFFRLPVIYRKDSDVATRFQRDKNLNRQYENIDLLCLVVWNDKSKTDQSTNGAHDFGDGYILLRYDDCLAAGIVDADKNLTTTAPQDRINFNNVEYYVDSVVKIAQVDITDVLVKVLFRKDLKPA